jgi:transcriptional regulator with XRE-family HTH domain
MNTVLMKQRREALGLSQGDVGAALDRDRTTVTAWEMGRIVPDARLLRALAQLLGVTVDALLSDPDPEPAERAS